jgi:hypothetical protein
MVVWVMVVLVCLPELVVIPGLVYVVVTQKGVVQSRR